MFHSFPFFQISSKKAVVLALILGKGNALSFEQLKTSSQQLNFYSFLKM